MKVVQTRLSEQEYRLLVEHVRRAETTIEHALRKAVRSLVLDDAVDRDDPVFVLPPAGPKTGRKRRIAERHDDILYRRSVR